MIIFLKTLFFDIRITTVYNKNIIKPYKNIVFILLAYRKGCKQFGLKLGTSSNRASNILKRMYISDLTAQQKADVQKKAVEEHKDRKEDKDTIQEELVEGEESSEDRSY